MPAATLTGFQNPVRVKISVKPASLLKFFKKLNCYDS